MNKLLSLGTWYVVILFLSKEVQMELRTTGLAVITRDMEYWLKNPRVNLVFGMISGTTYALLRAGFQCNLFRWRPSFPPLFVTASSKSTAVYIIDISGCHCIYVKISFNSGQVSFISPSDCLAIFSIYLPVGLICNHVIDLDTRLFVLRWRPSPLDDFPTSGNI